MVKISSNETFISIEGIPPVKNVEILSHKVLAIGENYNLEIEASPGIGSIFFEQKEEKVNIIAYTSNYLINPLFVSMMEIHSNEFLAKITCEYNTYIEIHIKII
jgi:hypothetical protein